VVFAKRPLGTLPLIADRKVADVVYGSRFYGRLHRSLYFHHYLGNRLISFIFNLLCNKMLSDIEVCYKMFSREVMNELKLTSNDFGIEIELSAQIARAEAYPVVPGSPTKAYASASGDAISGGTASQYGIEQISNIGRFGRLP
jgi:hypothetical protein